VDVSNLAHDSIDRVADDILTYMRQFYSPMAMWFGKVRFELLRRSREQSSTVKLQRHW